MMHEEDGPLAATDLGFEPITPHTGTAFGLLRLSAMLSDELDRELQASAGIGLSEMLVLIQLMLAGGRAKMAELATTLVVTRGGVTKIVDRLVDGGLVERVPSTSDRRVIYAEVTERAKATVREYQPLFDEIARRRLAELLDAGEMTELAGLIDRLNCENPGWEPPLAR
ncbi:MAG: MarR family transcriptional regulator [Actinomycetota bacterium]